MTATINTQSAWPALHNRFVKAAPPFPAVSSPLAYLLWRQKSLVELWQINY